VDSRRGVRADPGKTPLRHAKSPWEGDGVKRKRVLKIEEIFKAPDEFSEIQTAWYIVILNQVIHLT
jgi:hypothetical protein